MTTTRPTLTIKSCHAPMSKGGKFRRPVTVRVLAAGVSEWHAVRGLIPGAVLFEARNVDSRYAGPRSAFGAALAQARAVLAAAQQEAAQ